MARLPTPGGDDGNWGDILNEFLNVSLDDSGHLLQGAIERAGGVTLVNGQVPLAQLGSGAASSSNYLRGDGVWSVPAGASNATTSAPGIVQLDGDLGGTAANPTVTGLQGNVVATGTPSNQQVLMFEATTDKWTPTTLTASQVAGVMPRAGGAYTGAVVPATVALTDGANISLDASQGNIFTVTLAGNRTLNTPTNPTGHQMIILEVTQDATGGRTLSYSSGFVFSAGAPMPILSATAGATDYLLFIYSASAGKWRFLDTRLGY